MIHEVLSIIPDTYLAKLNKRGLWPTAIYFCYWYQIMVLLCPGEFQAIVFILWQKLQYKLSHSLAAQYIPQEISRRGQAIICVLFAPFWYVPADPGHSFLFGCYHISPFLFFLFDQLKNGGFFGFYNRVRTGFWALQHLLPSLAPRGPTGRL